jgi:hypothetical protein
MVEIWEAEISLEEPYKGKKLFRLLMSSTWLKLVLMVVY